MPDADYERCRFSITCHTTDVAVLHCLRSLCELHVVGCPKQIGWGGSTQASWRSTQNCVTFRFTSPADRDAFAQDANRLLVSASWREVSRRDDDPARRQRVG
jgi:hypothetical protein